MTRQCPTAWDNHIRGNWMENSPPCFQKERNKGGILHNDVLFGQNFDYFSYCFGPLGAKKFRLRRHFHCFSRFCVDCSFYRQECLANDTRITPGRPRQANVNCQPPMKQVQNTSDRQWMIYRRRRRNFLHFRAAKS